MKTFFRMSLLLTLLLLSLLSLSLCSPLGYAAQNDEQAVEISIQLKHCNGQNVCDVRVTHGATEKLYVPFTCTIPNRQSKGLFSCSRMKGKIQEFYEQCMQYANSAEFSCPDALKQHGVDAIQSDASLEDPSLTLSNLQISLPASFTAMDYSQESYDKSMQCMPITSTCFQVEALDDDSTFVGA